MEQESLLLQLPQRGREPADGHRVWGKPSCQVPASNPLGGQVELGCAIPGALCLPVKAPPSGAPLGPPLQNSAPPYSLVITDADDWPHQETPVCSRPPPLTRQHGPAPQLCLLRALAVNDAEEDIDGSLGGHEAGAVSHSPDCSPPTHWPGTQETHRGGPIDLIDNQAVGLPTNAQHRLHLRGRLNVCAEGLRTAVVTATIKQGGPSGQLWPRPGQQPVSQAMTSQGQAATLTPRGYPAT